VQRIQISGKAGGSEQAKAVGCAPADQIGGADNDAPEFGRDVDGEDQIAGRRIPPDGVDIDPIR